METLTFIYSFLHVMAVVVLMGGGIFNAWILDSAAEKALSPPDSGRLGMAVGKIWLVTAWTSIVVILVSGILLTQRAGAFNSDAIVHTTYGQLVAAKMVIIGSWLATASIITVLAMRLNRMMASGGTPAVEKLQATVARMKLLSKTNNVTGFIAVLLAVSMRLF